MGSAGLVFVSSHRGNTLQDRVDLHRRPLATARRRNAASTRIVDLDLQPQGGGGLLRVALATPYSRFERLIA
jgi:hypothetical protein